MKNAASVHRAAAVGYTRAADSYVRGRPDYPAGVSDWLLQHLDLHSDRTVLDLGAGTGKLTALLMDTGARVIAVEPVWQMLIQLRALLPRVEGLVGTAESIPLANASVDAVVCGQSFHWFATRPGLTEIHRVLKPGGRLGLIWNMRSHHVKWAADLDEIINHAEGDTPRYHTGTWRKAFPFSGFGPLHEQRFSHSHTGLVEDVVVDYVRSMSFIAALDPAARSEIDSRVRSLIAAEPELLGKTVVVPYDTDAFYTVKAAE